jgi:beta-1,2-mannobiose phosphorylase / 1,2-beta-oligomannan phosphorylase
VTPAGTTSVPCRLTRLGVVMSADPGAHFDAEAVLNPASAGGMMLDPDDPGTVLARTSSPLLEPLALEEREGTVPNVVFPTAIEEIDGQRFVFYGMADSSIGVARLDRVQVP